MFEEGEDLPTFEYDVTTLVEQEIYPCWVCLNRSKCPLHHECDLAEAWRNGANMDNDNTNKGDQ